MNQNKLLFLIISLVLFSSMVLAAEQVDQQQTSGGTEFVFSSAGDWARQSFFPSKTPLARIKLNLKVSPGVPPQCLGQADFDFKLLKSGSTIYSKNQVLTGLPIGSFGQFSFAPSPYLPLNLNEEYVLEVRYNGLKSGASATCGSYNLQLFWERSASSSAYPAAASDSRGENSNDFVFQTYVQVNPIFTITDVFTTDTSGNRKTTFKIAETVKHCIEVRNTGQVAGSPAYKYYIDGTNKYETTKSLNPGDILGWCYQDSYSSVANHNFEGQISPCSSPSTCSRATSFSIYEDCTPITWYQDSDGDGYGNPSQSTSNCNRPSGYVSDNRDCNDNNGNVYPGKTETCNGVDDNCNGQIDENGICTMNYYCDRDSDGYKSKTISGSCSSQNCLPAGCQTNIGNDCNDNSGTINPSATEICGDNIDNNCNDQTDENCAPSCIDNDQDAFGQNCAAGTDCDDSNSVVHQTKSCTYNGNSCGIYQLCVAQCPAPPQEVLCDGIDNDCNANTRDDACSSGKTCDMSTKQCVNTCLAGTKCKDTSTKGYQNNLCAWSSLVTAGTNAFCDSSLNDFKCNNGFANCDTNWQNGCEINTNTDSNNCGNCGNRCGINQACNHGTCGLSIITTSNTWVLIQSQLFYNYIYPYLISNHAANTSFFVGEREDRVEQILTNMRNDPLSAMQDADTLRSFVAMDGEKFLSTVNNVRDIPVTITANVGTDVYIAHYNSVVIDNDLAKKITSATEDLKKLDPKIKGIPLIDLGISVLVSSQQANPFSDTPKFLFYTTSNLAYNLNPIIITMNIANLGKKAIFFSSQITCDVINYQECEIPFVSDNIVNPISSVLDYFTDTYILNNTLEGQCGIINGQVLSCLQEISDDIGFWTHPFALTEDIKANSLSIEGYVDPIPISDRNPTRFDVKVRNHFGSEVNNVVGGIFKEIYVSAKVVSPDSTCNLGFKKISIGPGEAQETTYNWKVPSGMKNRHLKFETQNWYNCRYACCPPDASFCNCNPNTGEGILNDDGCVPEGEMFCGPEDTWPLSSTSNWFIIPNQPPIINSVTCNSLGYMGVPCPTTVNISAGDKLEINLETHDLDGNNLEVSYAGDYPAGRFTLSSCREISSSPLGKICTFTFQTQPEDVGHDYWANLVVSDGYNQTIRNIHFTITQNKPRIISPVENDITNTQTPLIKWTGISSSQPVRYHLKFYQDYDNNLLRTENIADPSPNTMNKEYTLVSPLPKDHNYWLEIVGVNNYRIELKSSKIKFFVDCYLDSQCAGAVELTGKYCQGNNVFNIVQRPVCKNPGQLNSSCGFKVESLPNETCQFGCLDNRCARGCQFNEPACGINEDCTNNQCVLKSGCQYHNPDCSAGFSCQENVCVETDHDLDNINKLQDCDDQNSQVWRNMTAYRDADSDGFTIGNPITLCIGTSLPSGYVETSRGTDCNDDNLLVWQNLTGYKDTDGDGKTTGPAVTSCAGNNLPSGYVGVKSGEDCNDDDSAQWQNLRGYKDTDNDGYTSTSQNFCTGNILPTGYKNAARGKDCNDNNRLVWNGKSLYVDADGDGYTVGKLQSMCIGAAIPSGYRETSRGQDCNDQNKLINPLAKEICDRKDNNCNGRIDEGLKICFPLIR